VSRVAAACLAAALAAACTHARPFVRGPVGVELPRPDAIEHRLLLIGDAGDPNPEGEPALDLLEKQVNLLPDRTTVVFLGDNVYETGMPDPTPAEGTAVEQILDEALLNLYASRRDAERRVRAQVKAADVEGVRAIFIPGNHDWDQFGTGGWHRVQMQEQFVTQLRDVSKVDVQMQPTGGCPGPVSLPLGRRAQLIVLDTQWWLEAGAKPSPEDNPTACPNVTEERVLAVLGEELRRAGAAGRTAVIAAHHPLETRGPHGGYLEPWVHLFPLVMAAEYVPFFVRWMPLPVLGSLAVWWRGSNSPSAQDLSSSTNEHMRRELLATMEDAAGTARPLVYAAGHDHSLQVFRRERAPHYALVSGLGSQAKASSVRHARTSLFAHSNVAHPGLMKLDFLQNGRVRLGVVEWGVDTPDGVEVYSHFLEVER